MFFAFLNSLIFTTKFTNVMSKTTQHPVSTMPITSLSITEQVCIKGGMAATEEEKRKKIKK
jgi:hypothetical protein